MGATTEAGLFMVTRFPQPGRAKTRLIPVLGPEGAAQFQRQMTEYLLARFQRVCRNHQLALEVHFADGTLTQMADWLGSQVSLQPQCDGDLGRKLNYAFERGFASGLRRVLMVGSDCPGIGGWQITQALTQLNSHDVVLGPAEDGGYYLVGLKTPQPKLFETISWGKSCVLQQTLAIANRHRLSVALLNPLPDIDRPEDLPLWTAYSGASSSSPQMRL
ncbi:MAG: TIGR04282 family arsenosugar biosynthesis glycosyltransferase [Thainema sp.]